MNKNSQNGNAIVIILVAIALFAALGYAFSNTSRTSSKLFSDEETVAYANQVITYGNEVRSVIKRLQLRGCSDTDISFENNIVAGYANTNPDSPTDESCHVFSVNGGGLTPKSPDDKLSDSSFSGQGGYKTFNVYGRSCRESITCYSDTIDNEDLILFYPYLKRDICLEINNRLGITNPLDDAPIDGGCSGLAGIKFNGNYSEGVVLFATELEGHKAGCFRHTGGSCAPVGDAYGFYQVLIER